MCAEGHCNVGLALEESGELLCCDKIIYQSSAQHVSSALIYIISFPTKVISLNLLRILKGSLSYQKTNQTGQ